MKLRLIFVLLLLASFACKHKDDLVRPPANLQSGSMNVGKAQAHFSKYDSLMRLHAHTRAEGRADSSLYPGIFTPKWGDAVESASKDRSSVESDISATNYFIAKWNDGVVTVKQRLIVLQVGDNVQMGIETIIPTVDFQTKYPDYYTHYVNNGNSTFSGMVLFHTISGNFSQIVYLHNGRRLASYYTPELTEQNLAQVKQRVGYIMGSLKLRLVSTAATRVGDDIDGGWIEAVGITVCRICLKRDLQCVCRPKEFPYVNWADNSCDVDRGDSGGGGSNPSDETDDNNEKPCVDEINNKANPFFHMRIQRSSDNTYRGGTFGYTRTDDFGNAKFHNGVDLSTSVGTDVHAMFSGRVVSPLVNEQPNRLGDTKYYPDGYGGDTDGAGNRIYIESTLSDGRTVVLSFWHLGQGTIPFNEGDWVNQGDIIGKVGITGNGNKGYGAHLHINAKDASGKIDPAQFLNATIDSDGKVTSICGGYNFDIIPNKF